MAPTEDRVAKPERRLVCRRGTHSILTTLYIQLCWQLSAQTDAPSAAGNAPPSGRSTMPSLYRSSWSGNKSSMHKSRDHEGTRLAAISQSRV